MKKVLIKQRSRNITLSGSWWKNLLSRTKVAYRRASLYAAGSSLSGNAKYKRRGEKDVKITSSNRMDINH